MADPFSWAAIAVSALVTTVSSVYSSEQQSKASRRQAEAQEEANRIAEEQAEENEQETNRANAEQVNAAAILADTERDNPNVLNSGQGIMNIGSTTKKKNTLAVGNSSIQSTGQKPSTFGTVFDNQSSG